MKRLIYGTAAIVFVLVLSIVGYAASDATAPTDLFPQTYKTDPGPDGTTMQEACITQMADMGMSDEAVLHCAEMMDQMDVGHMSGTGHHGMGFMDRMMGIMTGMMGKGSCMMGR